MANKKYELILKVFLLLLLVIVPYAQVSYSNPVLLKSKLFYYNIVLSYLSVLCALLFIGRFGFLLKSIVTLLFFISILSSFAYDGFLNIGSFFSILETDAQEVLGYGLEFVNLTFGLAIIFGCMFGILIRNTNLEMHIPKRVVILILFLMLVIPLPYFSGGDDKRVQRMLRENTDVKLSLMYNSSILNPMFLLWMYIKEQLFFDSIVSFELPEYVSKGAESDYDKIYLVLGESASVRHFSYYGYKIPTTPFLDQRVKEKNFLWVGKSISPAPITRDALPRILSFATAQDYSSYDKYINVVNAAKTKDFQTFWLSSQPKLGFDNGVTTKIGIAAHESVFNSDDDQLMNLLVSRLDKKEKQFFVLHLDGSHAAYNNHTINDLNNMLIAGSDFPNYDATIKKTDRILNALIERISIGQEKSLLIYLSDHGEVVGKGHGLVHPSKDQYDVPWFVYDTTLNMANNVNFISRLTKDNIFNTQYTNEFILLALGFEFQYIPALNARHVLHSSGELFDYKKISDNYSDFKNVN